MSFAGGPVEPTSGTCPFMHVTPPMPVLPNKVIYKKTRKLLFFFCWLLLTVFVLIAFRFQMTENDGATYGTVTGKSGPSSLEPSQKQSNGVIMAHGKIFSKIYKFIAVSLYSLIQYYIIY